MTTIDISEETIARESSGLLRTLLKDRTTNKSIVWATHSYELLGKGFGVYDRITPSKVTGLYANLIQPRSEKSKYEQKDRTKVRAEVFTPTSLVKKQVDAVDQDFHDLDLQAYLKLKWLEITCGEAPYMVSRYDTVTGQALPLEKRVGFLDRKLHRLSKEVHEEAAWFKGAVTAYQSSYGYEFQGDSLLLARENLFASFTDYYQAKFAQEPSLAQKKTIAQIVSYNVLQMDGLNYSIPSLLQEEATLQLSLFEEIAEQPSQLQKAQIKDWKTKKLIDFECLSKGENHMKFDVVIGNPPYQEETTDKEMKQGQQKRVKSIFQNFQIESEKISRRYTVLIYPGGRWIHQSGKGMKQFGYNQINDIHLRKLIFYKNADELFTDVGLADGISVVVKDLTKESEFFDYYYVEKGVVKHSNMQLPGKELIVLDPDDANIVKKIDSFVEKKSLKFISESEVINQKLFQIESNFAEVNSSRVVPYIDQEFDKMKQIKLLTNDKAGKTGRAKWFLVDRELVTHNSHLIDEWQVVVSSANAGGQKRDNQLAIIDSSSAFGRSRLAIKSFKSEEEANNFFKYMQSYLVRFAFLMSDEAITSLGKKVPDLIDYSNQNTLVDFVNNIDEQLFSIIKISESEISYIVQKVDSIRNKR